MNLVRLRPVRLAVTAALVASLIGGAVQLGESAAHARPIASALSEESIFSTTADLVGMAPRATGSPGGERAANYVSARFRGAGLDDVYVEKATSYDWTASDYGLRVGGTVVDAYPVSHSFVPADGEEGDRSTGPDGLTREVVDLGSSGIGGKNVAGKIVLFDLAFHLPTAGLLPLAESIHDPDRMLFDRDAMLNANPYLTSLESTVRAAQQAGAAGFIGVLRDYFDSNRYHNEYYRKLAMTIPGLWVTRTDGAHLRKLLPRNGNKARLDLSVKRRAVVGQTVVGILEGRSKDTVMVQSHHDSVGPGAVEDATGVAEVIALAEHYGSRARANPTHRRDKTMMFITFDTHFTGYQSHMAFVDKYVTRRATPWRIVANATVEHIGKFARTTTSGRLVTTAKPEPKGIFENVNLALKGQVARSLAERDVRASTMLNATPFHLSDFGIPTDASFVLTAGVPIVSFIAGPLYMYDDADTLDKVDRSQLRPVALFFTDVLDAMERTPSASLGLVTGR